MTRTFGQTTGVESCGQCGGPVFFSDRCADPDCRAKGNKIVSQPESEIITTLAADLTADAEGPPTGVSELMALTQLRDLGKMLQGMPIFISQHEIGTRILSILPETPEDAARIAAEYRRLVALEGRVRGVVDTVTGFASLANQRATWSMEADRPDLTEYARGLAEAYRYVVELLTRALAVDGDEGSHE